jgi:hypothetical protein
VLNLLERQYQGFSNEQLEGALAEGYQWAKQGALWQLRAQPEGTEGPTPTGIEVTTEQEAFVEFYIEDAEGNQQFRSVRVPLTSGQTLDELTSQLNALADEWLNTYGHTSVGWQIQYIR